MKYLVIVSLLIISCKSPHSESINSIYYMDFDVEKFEPLYKSVEIPSTYPFIKNYKSHGNYLNFMIAIDKNSDVSFSFSLKDSNWLYKEKSMMADIQLINTVVHHDRKLYTITYELESKNIHYVNVESKNEMYQYIFSDSVKYKSFLHTKKIIQDLEKYRIQKVFVKDDVINFIELQHSSNQKDSTLMKSCFPLKNYKSMFMLYHDIDRYDNEIKCNVGGMF